MSTPTTLEGDVVVSGAFRAGSIQLPTNSVGNTECDVTDPIATENMYHRFSINYHTLLGAPVAANERLAYTARSPGVIMDLRIVMGLACTGTTSYVKAHIKKNGVQITSTPATMAPTNPAYVQGLQGTFSNSTFTTGNTLEFDIQVSAGDGTIGQELLVILTVNERPV